MRPKCFRCKQPVLWLPTLESDTWRCDWCRHETSSRHFEPSAERVEMLADGALSGSDETRRAATAALEGAPHSWLEFILQARSAGSQRIGRPVSWAFAGLMFSPIAWLLLDAYGIVNARSDRHLLTVSLVLTALGLCTGSVLARAKRVRLRAVLGRAASKVLARGTGVQGICASTACLDDAAVGDSAAANLSELATEVTERDAAMLPSRALARLVELTDPAGVPRHISAWRAVVQGAVAILGRSAYAPAIAPLRRLGELRPEAVFGDIPDRARTAADDIEARIEQAKYNRTLLRAASPDSDASTLLRSAAGGEAGPEVLLRPVREPADEDDE